MALPFEMGYVKKTLPVFRVGMWARDANGVICYIAQDIPAENAWSACSHSCAHQVYSGFKRRENALIKFRRLRLIRRACC